MNKPATVAGTLLAAAAALTACASGTPAVSASGANGIQLPPTSGVFDYQLGEIADRVDLGDGPAEIDVVVRDATAEPLEDAYSVCYVNGFQTQPAEAAFWLSQDDLLLRDAGGDPVVDPDWPDEYILDPSTPDQRAGILEVVGPIIDGCATDGFDAVEIDNLDTWTRFDEIDMTGAHALAAAYVERAHTAGLAIAQKNAAEMTPLLHDELGFDFAVTEECGAWAECAAYTEEYGAHVLQIEYPDALEQHAATFGEVCDQPDRAPLAILRDRALVAPGSAGYVYRAC
ncbi:endo alpha-1,4 polygalactosaminidase [Microbacterium sp. JZ31]|uniref:endo alpha-1,4 polygalactosaminidase n=1 Tax=Microbacterium sp. JZ31 TaxID=1906274 RepID=UPI0019323700|nr:endo alpha-1,4 polygalactosaminidase [Microbacterium sp. JZ31]